MGNDNFQPPISPKPLNQFWAHMIFRTVSQSPPTMQNLKSIWWRGEEPVCHSLVSFFAFLGFFGVFVTSPGRTGGQIPTMQIWTINVFWAKDVSMRITKVHINIWSFYASKIVKISTQNGIFQNIKKYFKGPLS